MGTQAFLEGVIDKICLNRLEVESKAFKFCNKAITNGHAKYQQLFSVDSFRDDFMLQVLCNMMRELSLLKNDMRKISAERDAVKIIVDRLKFAKRRDEERNNVLVKANRELEQQLTVKLAEHTQRKEASDKPSLDSSREEGSGTEASGDRQLVVRPSGEQRFTQVPVRVKKAYPEESLEVDYHRKTYQQRKRDISDLNNRAAQLSGYHADTDGHDEDAVHQKIIAIQQRITIKQKQQQHHFETGCALAKELNNRPLIPAQIEALDNEDAGRQKIAILVKRCNQEVVKQERERRVAARLK